MSQYTQGPYRLGRFTALPGSYDECKETVTPYQVVVDTDNGPYVIAECNWHFSTADALENARRIVACMNYCKVIETAELECGIHLKDVTLRAFQLKQQRDELLEFLREIESVTPQDKALWIHTVKCKASALITKAKEGA